jgi:hypothetical protein
MAKKRTPKPGKGKPPRAAAASPPPPEDPGRRTPELRRKHLAEMAKSLADGRGPTEVVEAAAAGYGVSVRQAWDDYAEIRRQWAEAAETERQDVRGAFGLALLRRGQLYRIALQVNDLALALEVEQDRCKLLGLYTPDQTTSAPVGRPLASLTLEQLRQLEAILGPAVAGGPGTGPEGDPA